MKKKIEIDAWFSSENRLKDYFKDNGCHLYSHSVYPIYDSEWEEENKRITFRYNYGLAFTVNSAREYEHTESQVLLFCRNNKFDFNTNNFPMERHGGNIVRFNLYKS